MSADRPSVEGPSPLPTGPPRADTAGVDVATTSPRRTRTVAVAVVAAAAIIGVLIGVAIARDDDGTTAAVSSGAQVASVQQACQQWLDGNSSMMGDPDWCSAMAGWMSQSMMGNGMGPQMMWGDPERMRATCEQWMTTDPPAGATVDPGAWCASMVDWMATHMRGWSGEDTWDGWMNGPMMGG